MIKKHAITYVFCLVSWCVGQLSAQSNTVASGGDASGSGGSVSYTVGQIDYLAVSAANGTVTQGVQQPYEIYEVGTEGVETNFDVSLYPNPASDFVILDIAEPIARTLRYTLYGVEGRQIQQSELNVQQTYINLESLSAGTYFVTLYDQTQLLRTFKVVKNH